MTIPKVSIRKPKAQDELRFKTATPARTSARITCRVCQRPAEVPIDWPALLCRICIADLAMCEAHAAALHQAATTRLMAAIERWEALLSAADAETRGRWEAYERAVVAAAGDAEAQAAINRRRVKTILAGGPLAELFQACIAREDEADACNEMLERVTSILAQVEAAQ